MTDTSLTEALREAYASAPTDSVILHTIELRHPAFTAPIRVVRDFTDLAARLEPGAAVNGGEMVTFTGYAFDVEVPAIEEQGSAELTLIIDNVSREITRALEAAVETPDRIVLTYRPYLSTDLEGPQMDPPMTMTIVNVNVDALRVTATAIFDDFSNRRFPNEDYTIARFPGLSR